MRRLALSLVLVLPACAEPQLSGEIPSTPAASPVAATSGEAITATLLTSGATGRFTLSSRNGDAVRYDAPDGSALVLRDGILISTFALGYDLISADVLDLAARITSGAAGPAERVHRYLDGENRAITRAFVCKVTLDGRGAGVGAVQDITETCQGSDVEFTNTYLRDRRTGRVDVSTQWIGAEAGYLRISKGAGAQAAIVPIVVAD